jgi:hypothetical protein
LGTLIARRTAMNTSTIPQAAWIDRCAARLGTHDIGISPNDAANHADELWRNVSQDLSPEAAADMAVGSLEAIEHLFCHC